MDIVVGEDVSWRPESFTNMLNFSLQPPFAALQKGEGVYVNVQLHPHWLDAFLRASCDQNFLLHESTQGKLVQGVALAAVVGAVVSRVMPHFKSRGFTLEPKIEVFAGSSVRVKAVCTFLGERNGIQLANLTVDMMHQGLVVLAPQTLRLFRNTS